MYIYIYIVLVLISPSPPGSTGILAANASNIPACPPSKIWLARAGRPEQNHGSVPGKQLHLHVVHLLHVGGALHQLWPLSAVVRFNFDPMAMMTRGLC